MKSMSLNKKGGSGVVRGRGGDGESRKLSENGGPVRPPAVIGAAVGTTVTIPVSQMGRAERRELRRKLRWQLEQVLQLSIKLDSRERELKGLTSSVAANPALSDAQFSVNYSKRPSCTGKEVTSELSKSPPLPPSHGPLRPLKRPFPSSSPSVPTRDSKRPQHQPLGRNPPPLTRSPLLPSAPPLKGKRLGDFIKQAGSLLRQLLTHKFGWVFREPVDAVKLGLTDYHSIIHNPMDLGTIKVKLSKKEYTLPSEFARDVRLTFSNAMTYNPQGHEVHTMADSLRRLFEEKWRVISRKFEEEGPTENPPLSPPPPPPSPPPSPLSPPLSPQAQLPTQVYCHPTISNQSQLEPSPRKPPSPPPPSPPNRRLEHKPKPKLKPKAKRSMTFQEKKKLSSDLQVLPIDKLECIVQLMKERNPNLSQKDDEIEVDIDTFDNDTLWELHRFVSNCMKSINHANNNNSKATVDKSRDSADQAATDGNNARTRKGEIGEEDVDIDDDLPRENFAPVVIDKDGGCASRSSSSGSSSSDSGSSSDSDSGSSSDSDSDVGDGDKKR